MRKILLLLFVGASLATYSQKTDLATVNTVKPKKGQKMAFESVYKKHVAMFHQGDQKTSVYEILSGTYTGYYHLVNSGRSYADFDKERADATAHSLDLDKNFFPLLDETMNGTFRFVDSISLRPDVQAESYVVTVRHLKMGIVAGDYYRELSRAVKILSTMKGGFFENLSFTVHSQLWAGSDQVTVSIRNLKDGFKSLEQDYYGVAPAGAPNFREAYEKTYGFDAWDARVKILDAAVEKTEQYIMKFRKDLSSQ